MLLMEKMVGAERFELSTSCTPSKRASQATLRPDRVARPKTSGAEYREALRALQSSFREMACGGCILTLLFSTSDWGAGERTRPGCRGPRPRGPQEARRSEVVWNLARRTRPARARAGTREARVLPKPTTVSRCTPHRTGRS